MPSPRRKRLSRKLARVRLADPKAIPNVSPEGGYTRREARKIRRATRKLGRQEQTPDKTKRPAPFDPQAPLTGKAFRREVKAAQRLQFGGATRELKEAEREHGTATAVTGTLYDDYRKALSDAQGRIDAANQAAVGATETSVGKAYDEDKASVEARNKAATAQGAAFGINPAASDEGARAVEAQRSQGTQAVGGLRGQAAADTALMEKRGATSVLQKAEALGRATKAGEKLRRERSDLAKEKGAFRTAFRTDARKSEREWAAIQKEFGLKKQELKQEGRQDRAGQRTERMKANAQKVVARIYASADKAGARAQIRVAKLQLEKGKISQKQYKEIKNIYEGLPGGGGGATGSGGPKLQNWEKDRVETSVRRIKATGWPSPDDKKRAINVLIKAGVEPRLARTAWRRYEKQWRKRQGPPSNTDATGGY